MVSGNACVMELNGVGVLTQRMVTTRFCKPFYRVQLRGDRRFSTGWTWIGEMGKTNIPVLAAPCHESFVRFVGCDLAFE